MPASNESQRLQALTKTQILDSLSEQAYDDLVTLASQICGTPIALISMVDRDCPWFKAKVGLQTSATHRDLSFCAHAILAPDDVFSIHDTQRDARFFDSPLVTGVPNVRFYAGASIVTDGGEALGTVCVIDTRPRTLDDAQKRCLQILARQAAGLLKTRQAAAEATRQVRRQEILTDEARLKHERGTELLDLVLQGGDLGMWDLHVTSGQWTINERQRERLGIPQAEATAERVNWRDLICPDDWPGVDAALKEHLASGSSHYECTLRRRHRAGHWVWLLCRAVVVHKNAAGQPIRIVGTHQDISAQRETQRLLDALARTDAFTGLANRQHFAERVTDVMARARRCVREVDIVARYAGDEFVIVLEGLAGEGQALKVAAEIQTGMQLPFVVEDADLTASASIGLTHFAGPAGSVEEVLARAEAALQKAKVSGHGLVCTA